MKAGSLTDHNQLGGNHESPATPRGPADSLLRTTDSLLRPPMRCLDHQLISGTIFLVSMRSNQREGMSRPLLSYIQIKVFKTSHLGHSLVLGDVDWRCITPATMRTTKVFAGSTDLWSGEILSPF